MTIANFLRTAIMKDICDWLHLVIICLWLVRIPLVWSQYIKSTFTDYMLSLLFLRTKLATFSKKDHKTSNKPNTLVQRFNLYLCFYQDISETRTNPVDTGHKFNVHKTFRRSLGRLLNVLCTFNLPPVSTGNQDKF